MNSLEVEKQGKNFELFFWMKVYCSQSLQSIISWINSEQTNEITIQLTEYLADQKFRNSPS